MTTDIPPKSPRSIGLASRIDVAGTVILLAGTAFLVFAWSSILLLAMP